MSGSHTLSDTLADEVGADAPGTEGLGRVLIAEDEALVLESYRAALADPDSGVPACEPVLCRQGEAAVAAVRQARDDGRPFAVAFLDVRMPPGIDGIEAARRIRALDPAITLVLVTGQLTRPAAIAAAARDLDPLVYIAKPVQPIELQRLAAALTAKWRAERRLQQANAALAARCAELEALRLDLMAAKHQAEEASRAKTAFLAAMSHELRTPLNAIIGFSQLIADQRFGAANAARHQEYAADIMSAGSHLLGVIGGILDLAHAEETGRIAVRADCIAVAPIGHEALRMVAAQADQKSVALVAELEAAPMAWADPGRLRQVLLNLLSNAVKFTPAGGTIRLSARRERDRAVVEVRDTGIGMSAAELVVARTPFGQVDSSLARRHEGTGLGLPLAERLVEAMGGTFMIDSAPGQGTRVRITLPTAGPGSATGLTGAR